MNWEEHLEYLNSATMEELDKKIEEQVSAQNESAKQAMNSIHWALALAITPEEMLEKIRVIESNYSNSNSSIEHYRKKIRKEQYEEDPQAYKEMCEQMSEFAEKLKREHFNKTDTNDE